jgi:hypothetical protein
MHLGRNLLFYGDNLDVLRSLAVVLGRHTAYLPGPERPQPFEALSATLE